MMNDYTFASALLATKSADLLTKNQFGDLRQADDAGFVLKLHALGYGLDNKNHTVSEIVESEVIKLKEELREITPHDDLSLFFFAKYDLTNIRSFYKKKLFNIEFSPIEEAGHLSEKELTLAILKNEYSTVDDLYKNLFFRISEQQFQNVNALVHSLQQTFQDLLFEAVLARKDEALKTYFVISTDINNLLTLLRVRRLELNAEYLRSNLLGHGSIDIEEITALLPLQKRDIAERYSLLFMSRFVEPLERFFSEGDFAALEHSLLKVLLEELNSLQIDIRSSSAIITYVIRKQIEIIDIHRLFLSREAPLMVEA